VDNAAVAAVFAEMGDLLAIVGGDAHRARAFRNTARIVEGLRAPLKDMALLGQLTSVPGLGAGSIERIHQILQTGTCPEHQRLVARLPRGLQALLQVRGLGPRHARLAWEHLGVSSVEQLELAARSGLFARVPGIGPLTVERVLRDLDGRREAPPARLLLSEALVIGEAIVGWMLDDPHTIKAEQTGSARRRRETVGDLDVLVASTKPLASSARFTAFPGIREVLLAGDGRASVILDNGVQADLRLVSAENWGAGQHYFTGSKAHNIAMRIRANAHKLALSEMGIWERKLRGRGRGEENRKIARRLSPCTDEVDVFTTLGLPFIPPELREGDGEIEAALAGRLPALVEDRDLVGEPHLRARTASDALSIAHALHRLGRRWAIWVRPAVDVATDDARRRFRRDARRVSGASGVQILCAVEVAIDLEGRLVGHDGAVVGDDVCGAVDVVIGDATVPGGVVLDRMTATARVLVAIGSGRLHGLTRVRGRTLPHDPAGVDVDLRTVLLACARQRVFVEVSGEPDRLDLDAPGCRLATETGALLALSGRPADDGLPGRGRFALWQARRGWVTAPATLNALPLVHLRTHLRVPPHDALTDDDEAGDDDNGGSGDADADDPLFLPHRRLELMTRLSAFLRGEPDPELQGVLLKRGDNALLSAFAILSGLGDE
jgi:DNA polymerase (family 10)